MAISAPETQLPGAASVADAAVAVIIVNYRTPQLTKQCLTALRGEKALLPKLRAIVVDGGSGDGSAAELAKAVVHRDYRTWVSFLPLPINGGFGWANNQAMLALAREQNPPEYIHLLNPDAEVTRGAVAQLVAELRTHPRCGAAGSQLLTLDGEFAASAFRFPSPGREFVNAAQAESIGRLLGVAPTVVQAAEGAQVDWLTGASVMVRTEALRATGLFDDGFFLYFEEVELMHRLRARGWTVRHVLASRVVHIEGASTGLGAAGAARPRQAYWYKSRRRYFMLTGGRLALIGANLAWTAGRAIAMLKMIAGRPIDHNSASAKDLFRLGFWPSREVSCPSAPAWGDPPGKSPQWMAGQ